MKIFITGSSGFIGTALISAFLQDEYNVVIGYDNKQSNQAHDDYSVIGDILDFTTLNDAMPNDVDLILHLAAEHSDEGVNREDYFNINVQGTKNLLKVASEKSIKRIVFFSSVAIYGEVSAANENTKPNSTTAYAVSKLSAERKIIAWVREDSSRSTIILRPTAVYGPGNTANIYRLIKYVSEDKFIMIGKGKNIKSIIYVKNVVASTLFLINNYKSQVGIFNLVDEPHLTINNIIDKIRYYSKQSSILALIRFPVWVVLLFVFILEYPSKLLNLKLLITRNRVKKFIASTEYSGEKIRSHGYIQKYSTDYGLEETISWMQNR